MSIVDFDADKATWVGDDQDGCYLQVEKGPAGWYFTLVVDSETGGFCLPMLLDAGPFQTEDEAREAAVEQATEWCIANDVDWEETPELEQLAAVGKELT